MRGVPFEYVHHLVVVPVTLDAGRTARFVLDTGIGVTLLSSSLAAELGRRPGTSTYTGKRMSGQQVTVPLASLPSLALGPAVRTDLQVGVLDLALPPELGVDGFLGLDFFAETPFTVDYEQREVVIESERSLADRRAAGTVVGVRVDRDGPTICVFLRLRVAGGPALDVEVDMGSDELILDRRFAAELGIDLEDGAVRRVDGEDETGHRYSRYFTRLGREIHPEGAPWLSQQEPEVMLQEIVYDGLLGDAFLRNFTVTYDVARAEMIFVRR